MARPRRRAGTALIKRLLREPYRFDFFQAVRLLEWVRERYTGTLVGAEGFGPEDGARAVADGTLDAIAYGRPFVANPDLPARIAKGAPLNEVRRGTLYRDEGETGYVDYPFFENDA